jgi:hypothetical protein
MKPEEFVVAWNSSGNLSEVLSRLDLPESERRNLVARAWRYRKAGIPLKKFRAKQKGPRLDIEALTKLAEEALC